MRKVAKNGFPSGMGVVIMRVEKLPSLTAFVSAYSFRLMSVIMTRREQIEEMLKDLNEVIIWSNNDAEIDRIMPTIYWLDAELKELKRTT